MQLHCGCLQKTHTEVPNMQQQICQQQCANRRPRRRCGRQTSTVYFQARGGEGAALSQPKRQTPTCALQQNESRQGKQTCSCRASAQISSTWDVCNSASFFPPCLTVSCGCMRHQKTTSESERIDTGAPPMLVNRLTCPPSQTRARTSATCPMEEDASSNLRKRARLSATGQYVRDKSAPFPQKKMVNTSVRSQWPRTN
jgi:hypothetical protein